jgi:hypothetical protein
MSQILPKNKLLAYKHSHLWQGLALALWLVLACSPTIAIAQTEPASEPDSIDLEMAEDESLEMADEDVAHNYVPPPIDPIQRREIRYENWKDATQSLDYSSDVPKPQKEKQQKNNTFDAPNWNYSTQGIGEFLQVLAIIVALSAIAYAVYRTLQAPRNRKIAHALDGTIITADNIDAYIHETDLERFLRSALTEGNFSLAIRLYYLQIIKELSEKGAIKWAREKTNKDYLRETRDHTHGPAFRQATRTFERIWYGNESLDEEGFKNLEPAFKELLDKIR